LIISEWNGEKVLKSVNESQRYRQNKSDLVFLVHMVYNENSKNKSD